MTTINDKLQAQIFDYLRKKMNSGSKLTFSDIESIALYDVALGHELTICRGNGVSLQDTLMACVFVLAEQKMILRNHLMECSQRNETG